MDHIRSAKYICMALSIHVFPLSYHHIFYNVYQIHQNAVFIIYIIYHMYLKQIVTEMPVNFQKEHKGSCSIMSSNFISVLPITDTKPFLSTLRNRHWQMTSKKILVTELQGFSQAVKS